MKHEESMNRFPDIRARQRSAAGALDAEAWEAIFRSTQVPIYVQDISGLRAAVRGIKAGGVREFDRWLDIHPEFISRAVGLIRILDVNDAAVELNGAANRMEMLSSLDRLILPETLKGFKGFIKAIARGDEFFEGECLYCTLGGRQYHAMNRAWIPSERSDTPYLVLATFDITDLKVAQEALAGSEERYRLLVETAQDVIIRHDLNGRVTFANKAALALTGLEADEILGMSAYDFVPRELHDDIRDRRNRRAEGSAGVFIYETVFLARGGAQVPMEVSSTLLASPLTGEGEPQVLLIARDISERKKVEREKLELEARLLEAQKLESLGELAGGLSNDFNNLLATIMGNAELALQDAATDAGSRQNLKAILEAGGKAADLCRQLQAYSGNSTINTQSSDLSALVEDFQELLKSAVAGRSQIHFELAADLPPVHVDPTRMRQVVLNLVSNAAESIGDEGGEIMVRTGTVELGRRDLEKLVNGPAMGAGTHVFCEIRDSGCGMNREVASRFFDPFFTTKLDGRGLGLSAALGIVKSHRGGIRVETVPKQGTTLAVMLPAAAAGTGATGGTRRRRSRTSRPLPDLQGKLVLLVDDDASVREMGGSFLRRLGCSVLLAADGFEAVRIFGHRHREIDLVLLDFSMVGLDGLATFRRLRVIRPDIPVLLTSGFDAHEVEERAEGLDYAGFVAKPYSLKLLREVLGAALGTGGVHTE